MASDLFFGEETQIEHLQEFLTKLLEIFLRKNLHEFVLFV